MEKNIKFRAEDTLSGVIFIRYIQSQRIEVITKKTNIKDKNKQTNKQAKHILVGSVLLIFGVFCVVFFVLFGYKSLANSIK
jgi:hypothetical protein